MPRTQLITSLFLAAISSGCVKQTLPANNVSPSQGSNDPGMEGTRGSAAFALMDRSGYLQCPVALRAAEEAQITPDFRQQIIGYFNAYQSRLRPLIDDAKKNPRSIDSLTDKAKSVVTSLSQDASRLSAQPQFPEFNQRLKIVQSQVGLLTRRPLDLETGFDRLAVTKAQREKISPLLHDADKKLQLQQSNAFNGANLADLAEETINSGLQTRAALRAIYTPEQNKLWDTLTVPSTQP